MPSDDRHHRRRFPLLKCTALLRIALILYAVLSIHVAVFHLHSGEQDASTITDLSGFFGRRSSTVWATRSSSPKGFSACLLVMDDSHYLQEFLAYHYHSLNLRRVIIAMDPNSQTSPEIVLNRWKDLIDITFWWDERNYTTARDFQATLREVKRYFGPSLSSSPLVAQHKARQRIFYQKCLRTLKQEDRSWTLLTDTDEFLTIHYDLTRHYHLTTLKPNEPGSVAQFIQTHSNPSSTMTVATDGKAWKNLQSSPCLQIPRIRFGARESEDFPHSFVPSGWNATDFLTLRWRYHATPSNHPINKISKALLDLSRVSSTELEQEQLTSIHLPSRTFCSQPNLHTSKNDSFLVIHHYLGSLEQYQYRENDARATTATRSLAQFDKQSKAASVVADDDEIRPWFQGFVQHHSSLARIMNNSTTNSNTNAKNDNDNDNNTLVDPQLLLQDVGKLQPKSWTTYLGDSNTERCALCFFGLPRAFDSLVLPSIIQNILIPNARHNCDVFVHFYHQESEPGGRKNRGGTIDPTAIYKLQNAVLQVQKDHGPTSKLARTFREPLVVFTYDTNETFWESRGNSIEKYHSTKDAKTGMPVYFPYKAGTYQRVTLDNIVKQWHSIEIVFKLMVYTETQNRKELQQQQQGPGRQYTRVGMFRSDAMYVTPIDIALLQGPGLHSSSSLSSSISETDSQNRYGVQAGFAQMPVNDRLFYGPRKAVEIWATSRFEAVEERARLQPEPGFTMHSERFLNASIFPMIEDNGYGIVSNDYLCCLRVRADESIMMNDCSWGSKVTKGAWNSKGSSKQKYIEGIVRANCTRFQMGNGPRWVFLSCKNGG
jgi:hypothetical protein